MYLKNLKSPKVHSVIILSFFFTGWSVSCTFKNIPWVCYATAPSSGRIIFHLELQLDFCDTLAFSSKGFGASPNLLLYLIYNRNRIQKTGV